MRIAHIADIHIRGLSRHSEYKTIFTQFADDAKAHGVNCIFVGGDIFHTKTSGITPEYIDFMRWWLMKLADVSTVYLTLGNHDGNLTNASRQDAITPIVEALNDPRIILYKQSGVYEFHKNFNFCVYSLFDKEGWKDVVPVPGMVNIACFHGGVRSSVTETGWPIEEGPSVDFFNGYNLVLLGDIHRQQYLGQPRNGKPWIAYPGTPVCQNYAEGNQTHGYLIWDIDDDGNVTNVISRELIQPHPFTTVDWEGDIQKFKEQISTCIDGSRFRVRSSQYMSHEDVQKVTEALKKKNALELVFKSDHIKTKDVFSAGGLEMMRDDLRNIEVQMLLLRDFYQDSIIENTEWDQISELVSKYLLQVTQTEESPRHTIWKLKSLEFDNLFTYGKDNKINFEKLSGVVGIFGQNATGKSSIVGTIMYGLFNSTDRGPIKNLHIVNARKMFGEARVKFGLDSADYLITRETSKTDTRKGETIAATSLNVERIEDGEKNLLNGEARPDTEKVIRKLIGTQDDFLLTSMSTQGDLNRFINEGSSFRKLILTKFLDLDIFEKMHDAAKKDVNSISAILKSMVAKNWAEEKKSLAVKQKGYEEFLIRVDSRIEQMRIDVHDLQVKVALLKNVIPVSQDELDMAKKRISHLDEQVKKFFELEFQLQVQRDKMLEALTKIRGDLSQYDIQSLEKLRESGTALGQALMSAAHQLETTKEKNSAIKKSVKKLEVVPCGDKFPTCMFIKDSHIDREKLQSSEQEIAVNLQLFNAATSALHEWGRQDVASQISKHGTLIKQEMLSVKNLSDIELKLQSTTNALKEHGNRLQTEIDKLYELEIAFKKTENAELTSVQTSIKTMQDEIKKFDRMKMEAASGKGKVDSEFVKLIKHEEEWNRLISEQRLFELVANAFSKRGIPTKIINSQLPAINSAIAEILHGVVEYTIEMVADEESNAMEIFLNYGDSKRIIELASGMEKMFAAMAIRVALYSVTSLPKTDMFIIDEGFGVLDASNVEACNRLLTSLKKYFKTILVITHVDAIKDVADSIIEISKNEKDSKVYVE